MAYPILGSLPKEKSKRPDHSLKSSVWQGENELGQFSLLNMYRITIHIE